MVHYIQCSVNEWNYHCAFNSTQAKLPLLLPNPVIFCQLFHYCSDADVCWGTQYILSMTFAPFMSQGNANEKYENFITRNASPNVVQIFIEQSSTLYEFDTMRLLREVHFQFPSVYIDVGNYIIWKRDARVDD